MLDKDKTFLILSTIRRYLGVRSSYTKWICDITKKEWNCVPNNDKKTILEEIRKYTRSNECTTLEKTLWNEILDLGIKDKLIVER